MQDKTNNQKNNLDNSIWTVKLIKVNVNKKMLKYTINIKFRSVEKDLGLQTCNIGKVLVHATDELEASKNATPATIIDTFIIVRGTCIITVLDTVYVIPFHRAFSFLL